MKTGLFRADSVISNKYKVMKSNRTAESGQPTKVEPQRKGPSTRRWNNLVKSPEEQYQLKRQAVIAEASRAFGNRGYQSVSLDEIASSLNVTKPALYHYIKSKQELLYECHNLALNLGVKALDLALLTGNTGLKKVEIFISSYIDFFASELAATAVMHEINAMRPEDRKRIERRRRQFDLTLRKLIEEGIADGTIAPCNSKLAVFWFMSAINGIPRWFSAEGELSGSDIAKAFVDFLIHGIQAQTPSR